MIISKSVFAKRCNVSPGRVSQWLSARQIDGAAIVGQWQRAKLDAALALRQLKLRLSVDERFGLNGLRTNLDWLPEIGRLEVLCRRFEDWELECTHTDAGDPWCVIYGRRREAVVLHIARLDRRYIVEWPPRQRSMTMTTIEAAVDIALDGLSVSP